MSHDPAHTPLLAAPGLRFAFRIVLHFDEGPRLRFEPAHRSGRRGFVAVKGGEIEGPRLTGRVLPQSGGDWPRLWPAVSVETTPLARARHRGASLPGRPWWVREGHGR